MIAKQYKSLDARIFYPLKYYILAPQYNTLHEARLSAQRRGTKYGNETGWYAGYLVDGAAASS